MLKKKTAFITLITICLLLCLFATSCNSNKNEANIPTEITVVGIKAANNVTIYAENKEANHDVAIKVSRLGKYTCTKELESGTYVINKIKSKNRDYEFNKITTEFVIKEQEENKIEIVLEEIDLSGSLLNFLKKNAFTLIALTGLGVMWIIVKHRKNTYVVKDSSNVE